MNDSTAYTLILLVLRQYEKLMRHNLKQPFTLRQLQAVSANLNNIYGIFEGLEDSITDECANYCAYCLGELSDWVVRASFYEFTPEQKGNIVRQAIQNLIDAKKQKGLQV